MAVSDDGLGGPDYKALFLACPLPTFVWRDQEGTFRLVAVNNSARAHLEERGGTGLGATPEEVLPGVPSLGRDLRRCLDECRAVDLETPPTAPRTVPGNGQARHFRLHCACVAPDMVLAQVRDITARREAEALRDEVERVSRHDLKSPLNVIVGAANLLKDEPNLSPTLRESVEMIEGAGHSMLNLINVSLDILRIGRGEYEYQPRPVDLAALARRAADHLRARYESRDLALEVLVEGRPLSRASACIVPGDETLCHCVLESLIRCAMFLSRRGGVVRLSVGRDEGRVEVAARIQGTRDTRALGALLRGRPGGNLGLPSEVGLRNAIIAARTMGGGLEARVEDGETVFSAQLPG